METLMSAFLLSDSAEKGSLLAPSPEANGAKKLYICIPFEEIFDDQRTV
jgi:hypothetical protein